MQNFIRLKSWGFSSFAFSYGKWQETLSCEYHLQEHYSLQDYHFALLFLLCSRYQLKVTKVGLLKNQHLRSDLPIGKIQQSNFSLFAYMTRKEWKWHTYFYNRRKWQSLLAQEEHEKDDAQHRSPPQKNVTVTRISLTSAVNHFRWIRSARKPCKFLENPLLYY